jgi:hypothetical protein
MHTKFWSENLKRKDHTEDLSVDVNIIFQWIVGNRMRRFVLLVASSSRQGPVAEFCEHGNKTSGFTNGKEFFD